MDPANDPNLSKLLKEWRAPDAPPSLDLRVLGARKKWWSFLITGSIRLPVPVVVVIAAVLLLMAAALIHRSPASPRQSAAINLAEFQPVKVMNVRIIRGNNDPR